MDEPIDGKLFARVATATRFALLLVALGAVTSTPRAQCPEQPPVQNYTGAGEVVCPCFVAGEQAGSVFTLPPSAFPIEILRVGIGWGSQFGGNPQQLEEAIHIYGAGLPNPGTPIFSLPGPALNDGVINEFDLEPLPGEIVINSSPFSVTLEFMNASTGPGAPSVVHDGNGCQAGKNLVKVDSGAWFSACSLGVSGDWVFYVVYRPATCGGAGRIADGLTVPGTPLRMSRLGASQVLLLWDDSCSSLDDDYSVYQGTLGSYTTHVQKLCSTMGELSAVVSSPGSTNRYYLVVPHNGDIEGSYGVDSLGNERPPALAPCRPQQTGCP